MGNYNSRIKFKNSTPKPLPKVYPISDEETLTLYLSDNHDDIDRLHMSHFLNKYVFQSLFSSPIEDSIIQGGCKVLDVGCGPGTWLLSMSSQYKNSHFVGLDIKPLFPQEIKPSNLDFIEADINNRLPFDDEEFDFVHMGQMFLAITSDEWNFVFSELTRVTKQGGYIEISEPDITFADVGPILHKLCKGVETSCLKRNVNVKTMSNLDSMLESHPNITKFHRDERKIIMGPDGGKVGLIFQDLFLAFYNSEIVTKNLSAELGIPKEEFKNIMEKDLLEELKDPNVNNATCIIMRFWTQKSDNENI